jgi:hypothetical protein
VTPEGTTLYFDAFGIHVELFGILQEQISRVL